MKQRPQPESLRICTHAASTFNLQDSDAYARLPKSQSLIFVVSEHGADMEKCLEPAFAGVLIAASDSNILLRFPDEAMWEPALKHAYVSTSGCQQLCLNLFFRISFCCCSYMVQSSRSFVQAWFSRCNITPETTRNTAFTGKL